MPLSLLIILRMCQNHMNDKSIKTIREAKSQNGRIATNNGIELQRELIK